MYDYIVIGGGIIGVSTALSLITKHPDKRILLLEKENSFGEHQTGHNSGVIHAGVYYQPGSLKAKFCKEGLKETINFCSTHQIPYEQCGKLLVATSNEELSGMHKLHQRCKENEIEAEILDQQQLLETEPDIQGVGAILVKSSGIVNYRIITKKMAEQYEAMGGEYLLDSEIIDLKEEPNEIKVITKNETFVSKYLVCCAGLMADRMANLLDIKTNFQIIPFRGEYFKLPEKHNTLVKHLIYPIPNPKLPFLGIHLTRMIDGSMTVGPNAVIGFKREGYGIVNFSLKDTIEMFTFKGFGGVLKNHFRSGMKEMLNSFYKRGYLKQVQKYASSITLKDLQPYPAGVRAMAVSKDGSLIDDFLFEETRRSIHVCNAPSPAATSAIPICKYITKKELAPLQKLI